jgi:hypothetical protein
MRVMPADVERPRMRSSGELAYQELREKLPILK